ncbi:MAG: EamA family transporter [Chlorobiaceae bacterium]
MSWVFYFKALQLGNVSQVAPVDKLSVALTIFLSVVLLQEVVSLKVLLGTLLIVGGSILTLL